jgi:hypothetical protein
MNAAPRILLVGVAVLLAALAVAAVVALLLLGVEAIHLRAVVFAAAVAGFGLLLQDSPFKGSTSYDDVVVWAEAGLAEATVRAPGPVNSDRPDFIRLIRLVWGGGNG